MWAGVGLSTCSCSLAERPGNMTALKLHGVEINSVFDLLGDHEDDMTYALGWGLSKSNKLLKLFAEAIGLPALEAASSINLQRHEDERGFTDIELETKDQAFAIVEAKRGWELPAVEQLEKYRGREKMGKRSLKRRLVVLTAFDEEYVSRLDDYPKKIEGVPIIPLSWKRVLGMILAARENSNGLHEKWMLDELGKYFGRLIHMTRQNSNYVYVVALSDDTFSEGSKMTFIDVVEKHSRYFHPIGNRWPVEPPNYIAFRYWGELRSIHHIENVETIESFRDWKKSLSKEKIGKHFLYTLGPNFKPEKLTVRSGPIRNQRLWCFLDTLFIADTVQEAGRLTRERTEKMEGA